VPVVIRIVAISLLALGLQDGGRIKDLIEKLRSDEVAARDEAAKALKELGKAAVPALEEAAKSTDAEVASRAKALLKAIELRAKLPPGLLAWRGDIDEQLAAGGDAAATRLLLEAVETDDEGDYLHAALWREDLDPIAEAALRGVNGDEQRLAMIAVVESWGLRSAGPALVPLLGSSNPGIQMAAIRACGDLRIGAAVPELIKLLSNQVTCLSSVYALGAIGDKSSAREILRVLEGPNGESYAVSRALIRLQARELAPDLVKLLEGGRMARDGAALALAQLGGPEAVPGLVKLLQDPGPKTAAHAMNALVSLHSADAVPGLVKLLSDSNETVRAMAYTTLLRLHLKESIAPLTAALKSETVNLRVSATALLADLGVKEAVAEAWFQDKEAGVRLEAARAAGVLRAKETVPLLLKLLADESSICIAAARSLGDIGWKESIGDVAALLKSESAEVRGAAIEALGLLGAAERASDIAACAGDGDPAVRASVAVALSRIGGKEAANALTTLMGDAESDVRLEAVQGAERLGDATMAEALTKLLGDSDVEVARCTIRALAALGAVKAAGDIAQKLASDETDLQVEAAYAVAMLGYREAEPDLVKLLHGEDDDDYVIEAVGLALAKLRSKEGATRALKLLRNSDPYVRSNAVLVVGEMNLKEAAPILRHLLHEADWEVRSRSAAALARLDAVEAAPALLKQLREGGDDAAAAAEALGRIGGACVADLRKLLADKQAKVRSGAALALSRLGVKEAAAEIAELDLPGEPHVAAQLSCQLGRVEGVAEVIDAVEQGPLDGFCLNAVRRPAEWEKLCATRIKADLVGSPRCLFERAATLVGLKLDVEAGLDLDDRGGTSARPWILGDGRTTVFEALEWLSIASSAKLEMILDDGVLRIRRPMTGAAFWRAWALLPCGEALLRDFGGDRRGPRLL